MSSTSPALIPAKTYVTTSPEHYVWGFPGSPVRIHLALHVVQRLNEFVRNSETGTSQEGLLFGRIDGDIEILDFQAASSGSVTEMLEDLPNGPGRLTLVGYYRTEHGRTLCLNDRDRSLDEAFFGEPHHVFLMIQPASSGPPNATFFFHDGSRRMADFSFLEFPFDASRLAIDESVRIQRSQQAATEQAAASYPSIDVRREKHNVLKTARWLMLVLLVLASGMLINSPSLRQWGSRFWIVLSHPPPQAAAPANQIPLGLHAERQSGGDLKLTWNRQSAVVLSATSGVLSIKDGSVGREIHLDPAQLRDGSVLYAPATGQIQMQLTVSGPEPTSESLLVILPETGASPVQVLPAKEIHAATIAHAAPPVPAQPHSAQPRLSKPFTLPAEPRQAATMGSSFPVNEPPQLIAKTDPATLIPPALGKLVVPPPQPARPVPATQSPATQTAVTQPAVTQPVTTQPPASPKGPGAISSSPVYPPAVINLVPAVYPRALKSMGLPTRRVEIKVSIDQAGRVVKAEPTPQQELLPQAMVQAAVEAARLCKFKPARIGNQPVPGEMVLKFDFNHP